MRHQSRGVLCSERGSDVGEICSAIGEGTRRDKSVGDQLRDFRSGMVENKDEHGSGHGAWGEYEGRVVLATTLKRRKKGRPKGVEEC